MNKILLVSAVVLASTALALSIFSMKNTEIRYVELTIIYQEFSYSKELLAEHNEKNRAIIHEKDSLEKIVESLVSEKTQYTDTAGMIAFYLRAANERITNLDILIQEDKDRVNQKIWAQVNKEMADFGKKKGIRIVFGALGDGGIMYADENTNLTEDFIKYLNTPDR